MLRDDFHSHSGVDVLESFDPTATWSLRDVTRIADELTAIIGRRVDLEKREGLRDPFRRQHVIGGKKDAEQ